MHREISHADHAFQQESRVGLYLLTGLLGVLIGADIWPIVAGWIASWGPTLPIGPTSRMATASPCSPRSSAGRARFTARSIRCSRDASGRTWPWPSLAWPPSLVQEPLVAAEIVFIGMLGECLESITFARTQRAIQRIVEICPRRCWRLRDGREERILASELQVGDRVVVKPGGRVPADGVVVEGRSAVDVSALTGESLPLDKGPGDEVLAGSLNQFGR